MSKRKNIIIFAPYYYPHIGGVENYIKEFVSHIPENGFTATILAPLLPTDALPAESLTDSLQILRYPIVEPVHNFPIPKFWSPSFLDCYRKVSEQQCDVVISHTRFFVSSLLALVFAKFKKSKLVHTEHGSDFVQTKSAAVNFISKIYDYTFGAIVLRYATNIISISSAVEKFVKHLSGRDSQVIFRGLEFDDIEKYAADTTWKKNYPNKTIFISVSRLIKWKGLKKNLEAFANLSKDSLEKTIYVIAGDGPDREDLESFVQKNNLPVIFTGALSRDEVFALLKAGDVFIHGSMPGGGLSTTLIEAMYCNLPVIATPNEGASDIIQHLKNGYVINDHQHVDSLTAAINWHLMNKQQSLQHAIEGRKTVLENFSWESNIQQIIKIF
jgi:glycosyltransferase involved in cell wall biosynthesis